MESKGLKTLSGIENKAGRFLSLSVLLHTALLASIVLMNVPPIEFPKKEIVEFEVEKDSALETALPDGAPIPETKGAAPTESMPVKTSTATPPAPASPSPVVAPAALPDTLDDIQAPLLETSEAGEVAVAQMDENELQENFEKVDQAHHKALIIAKKSLDEETDKAAFEGDETLSEIDKENQEEAKAQAVAAEKRRAHDTAAIAAAEAAEKAADHKAGSGTADEGEGTGSTGSPEPTKEVAGIPGGVRSLAQLRQRGGNKFPQYDKEERLARQEGTAVFYAYVNKEGTLSQFKLGESSGYRNLDAKTLAALKKWKFHPGQEGWVEMPFQWTLTGEALEAGGQLRNSHR